MEYRGRACEVIGEKEVFGRKTAWIRLTDTDEFLEVPYDELTKPVAANPFPHIRFVAIGAKIKEEVAQKNILAPYESSLIPLPHQILVLEKVMQSSQNRFMLADEVGMGKTIEAGLILKELKIRDEIKRTLIIVPKSSMLQWQSEMKDHFNEVFHLYDSQIITSMARAFANINADEEFNFWTQHNQIIVSTDALKPLEKRQGWSQERVDEYNKFRMEAVLKADFDLIMIDEAHKMGGATSTVSRYVLAQELCNAVPNVLLLTATPHRGKPDHFRRVLQLLDPDAFAGDGLPSIEELTPYVIRTEKRHAIDYQGEKLFNERKTHRFDVELDPIRHAKQLDLYQSVTEYVRKGFNTAKRTKSNATGLIMMLFQRLVSSSSQAILSAMQGRLHRLQNDPEIQLAAFQQDTDVSLEEELEDFRFEDLYQYDLSGLENEEALLKDLIRKAEDCINSETDVKAEALLKKYEELKASAGKTDLKIIVFTEFRTTQRMLKNFFEKHGYKTVIINGSQDLDERKRALSNFRNEAQIMVATDAAGESLNMQFCHIVFNYDLPWNPMMIEQRIGRVDRIGQKYPVEAFNMLTNNSVDQRVYEVIQVKLDNILKELGIDKTSDVLDSTLDIKKINTLYLQSLMDPSRFDFAGDQWLHEIRAKLKDFRSTEGMLPMVAEERINYKKAADVKYSPLPYWLESLVTQNALAKNRAIAKDDDGVLVLGSDGDKVKMTFDPETSLNRPDTISVTLQHDDIRTLLSRINDYDASNGVPIISDEKETSGTWSLWQISAKNRIEQTVKYQALFLADKGSYYQAYANDIWNRLLDDNDNLKYQGMDDSFDYNAFRDNTDAILYDAFQKMEEELKRRTDKKRENKSNAYRVKKSRINKIGIDNIRISKLKKLEKEHETWLKDFESEKKIIPGIKLLMCLRVNG